MALAISADSGGPRISGQRGIVGGTTMPIDRSKNPFGTSDKSTGASLGKIAGTVGTFFDTINENRESNKRLQEKYVQDSLAFKKKLSSELEVARAQVASRQEDLDRAMVYYNRLVKYEKMRIAKEKSKKKKEAIDKLEKGKKDNDKSEKKEKK